MYYDWGSRNLNIRYHICTVSTILRQVVSISVLCYNTLALKHDIIHLPFCRWRKKIVSPFLI